jgi:hypothetical protein
MCAAPNSTQTQTATHQPLAQTSASSTSKYPERNSNQSRNKPSPGGKRKPMPQRSSSAQKPSNESRNAKRARWAKRSKPVAKPVVQRSPEREYTSVCCSAPARKPRAGAKEAGKDPETGKIKDQVKGLGHWRCSLCSKNCKVTVGKPTPKLASGSFASNSCPDVIYPAKLTTPEVTIAAKNEVA